MDMWVIEGHTFGKAGSGGTIDHEGKKHPFRAFEITPEYQERYGYPALTQEVKRKILGANAARLYGVTPPSTECEFTNDQLEQARAAVPVQPASYGPRTASAVAAHIRDHGWVGF